MPLSPGTHLGNFEVLAAIGEGGMGQVYSARDIKLGRKVALKLLPDVFASDAERLSRFEREARLLASLNHANIATLHGLEQSGGQSFLVMELVEGDTLADRIARGPLPIEDGIAIARQIVDALEAAHAKSIVHRDLKPANVKITPDGKVKVLDFGLAKALTSQQPQQDLLSSPTMTAGGTFAGAILGTAPYMSPEQAKGQDVDARSDIFSFGCVLFEMLTGRRSFAGASVTEAIASVLAREADLTLLPPNIHPEVRELLRRCLEKDPARRWQAIGDVRVELDTIAQDPHGAKVQKVQAQPRSWKVLAAAIAATAIIVAGVTTMIVRNLQPAPAPHPPVRFSYLLPRDQSFTRTGRHVLGIAPDGTAIAYVANNQLYLKSMSELQAKPIAGSNQDVNTPFFSPDGKWIAFCAVAEKKLKRIAVTGGASVTLADIDNPYGADWYADDAMLLGQGPNGIIRISTGALSKPETVVPAKAGEIMAMPQMLPDGRTVLFTVGTTTTTTDWDKAQIVVESLATHARTVLVNGGADARYVASGHIVYAVGSTLYAVPFDAGTLKPTGSPVPIVEDVSRATCCTGASFFAVSKAGTLASVAGTVTSQRLFALVQRNGDRKLLDLDPAAYSGFNLAADGRRLAVTVYEKEAANTWTGDMFDKASFHRLTFGGTNNFWPLWTRDYKRVVFQSDRDSPGSGALFWQPADGGTAERLTTPEKGDAHTAGSWSPNGVLAFEVQSAVRDNFIAGLRTDGDRKPFPLIEVAHANVWSPAFSPDGKWIAYASDESTRPEVFVQPYPTTGEKHLISPNGGDVPRWSSDGKLYFLGQSAVTGGTAGLGADHIMAVDVRTSAGFSFGSPTMLPVEVFTNFYEITPDGKQFLIELPPSETGLGDKMPLQINVVLNWFEELKRKTAK